MSGDVLRQRADSHARAQPPMGKLSAIRLRASLMAEVPVQEARLGLQRFLRFREVELVPEGMRQRIEHHQSRIHACPQECAMKVDGTAQTMIASGSHAERRGESPHVRAYWRKHQVRAVV